MNEKSLQDGGFWQLLAVLPLKCAGNAYFIFMMIVTFFTYLPLCASRAGGARVSGKHWKSPPAEPLSIKNEV